VGTRTETLEAAPARVGRFDEAILAAKKAQRETAAPLLEVDPTFTITTWIARGRQSSSKLLIKGLRMSSVSFPANTRLGSGRAL